MKILELLKLIAPLLMKLYQKNPKLVTAVLASLLTFTFFTGTNTVDYSQVTQYLCPAQTVSQTISSEAIQKQQLFLEKHVRAEAKRLLSKGVYEPDAADELILLLESYPNPPYRTFEVLRVALIAKYKTAISDGIDITTTESIR